MWVNGQLLTDFEERVYEAMVRQGSTGAAPHSQSSADEVVLSDATAAVQLEVQGADRSWPVGDKELLSMERTGGVAEDIGLCGVVYTCTVPHVCH